MSIHQFPVKPSREEATEALWRAYSAAAARAQKSLRFDDGVVAGKAWAKFIEAFEH